ncbi:hypothetical protein Dsin_002942 [Dipteronia sinensis]|uniref:Uncharacterized protein n=1 Tax=Dipteronia sinensis TaxID=43782 RepID=A0AAE0B756_9ROSI|nr:hypothetical protein Dsin_002942 [Dipteronia sinensis]
MAPKSNINMATVYQALLALFITVVLSFGRHGLQKYLEDENEGHFRENFVQLYTVVTRNIRDGTITLTIKFLHFLVSKSLRFRFLSPLQSASSIPSLLFWVAFTRSISSMSDDSCNVISRLSGN